VASIPVGPLLLVDGNCQAQHVAAMLRAAKIGEPVYVGGDYGRMPSHAGKGCRIVAPRDAPEIVRLAHQAGRRVIQISQRTPMKHGELGPLADVDKRILFPELRMWSLSRPRFLERFKANMSLERILELDLSSAETSEEKANFPVSVATFFRENVSRVPLFHTVNHPAGAIFSPLLRGIAVLLRDEIDMQSIEAVADSVAGQEGLNYQTDHPLSAEDRAQLKFDWGPDYELYAAMIRLREAANWDELRGLDRQLLALFSEDTQFWRMRMEMGRALDDEAMAAEALEQLLDRCPGVPGTWLAYANLLASHRNMEELQALAVRAEVFYEGAFAFDAFAARVFLLLGDLDRAEAHARACRENAPDELPSAYALLQVLMRRRDVEAFKNLVADLRAQPKIIAWQLNAFLASLKSPWIENVLGGIPPERTMPLRNLPHED